MVTHFAILIFGKGQLVRAWQSYRLKQECLRWHSLRKHSCSSAFPLYGYICQWMTGSRLVSNLGMKFGSSGDLSTPSALRPPSPGPFVYSCQALRNSFIRTMEDMWAFVLGGPFLTTRIQAMVLTSAQGPRDPPRFCARHASRGPMSFSSPIAGTRYMGLTL